MYFLRIDLLNSKAVLFERTAKPELLRHSLVEYSGLGYTTIQSGYCGYKEDLTGVVSDYIKMHNLKSNCIKKCKADPINKKCSSCNRSYEELKTKE